MSYSSVAVDSVVPDKFIKSDQDSYVIFVHRRSGRRPSPADLHTCFPIESNLFVGDADDGQLPLRMVDSV